MSRWRVAVYFCFMRSVPDVVGTLRFMEGAVKSFISFVIFISAVSILATRRRLLGIYRDKTVWRREI